MTRCVMDPWSTAFAASSAATAIGALVVCLRSIPHNLLQAARAGARDLTLMEDKMVALEGRWAARSKEFEALHEAIMDDVDRAEKKRRQASAAAARSAHGQKGDGEIDLNDIAQVRRLALQRGLL